MRSVVNLVRSQVYHTERPVHLICLQHVRRDACQRQLIFVKLLLITV